MEVYPQNTVERTFAVVVLLFALIFFSSFLSSITSAMTELRHLNFATNQQFSALRRFLKEREVSPDLSSRIKHYLEHRVKEQKSRIQENDVGILALLSEPLYKELQEERHKPTLCRHPFFEHYCSVAPHAMRKLCHVALSPIALSEGDTLFTPGDKCEQMVFVVDGRLLYEWWQTEDPQFPCENDLPLSDIILEVPRKRVLSKRHLEKGDWFGEACLWAYCEHIGTMRTAAMSNVLMIDAEKFMSVTRKHATTLHKTSLYAQRFVNDLNSSAEELMDLSKTTDEIAQMCIDVLYPEAEEGRSQSQNVSRGTNPILSPQVHVGSKVSNGLASLKRALTFVHH